MSCSTVRWEGKLDEETLLYRGRLKAMGHQSDVALNRLSAETAGEQGGLNAASYLLTGVGRGTLAYQNATQPLRLRQVGSYGASTGYADYDY
jgi:hypothetical protein